MWAHWWLTVPVRVPLKHNLGWGALMQDLHVAGGCLCGAIRYRVDGSVLTSAACHCRHCQYVSGGAPAYVFVVGKKSVEITQGMPSHYDNESDSGNRRRRYFCSTCGTPLFAEDSAYPDIVSVKAGSLDDTSLYKPMAQFWVSSAPVWHPIDPNMASFEKGPK